MMKKVGEVLPLLLLLAFMPHTGGTRHSLPGKPTQIRCRSPEKETFTCRWEPGSDGGMPTTYALYYRKEGSDVVHECPDYHTAGQNSCFFNKNNTVIWVNYNITVVATNALGRTFSDPVDIDVVYIVMPHPPEKLEVTVMKDQGWPFLRVSWDPPPKADTRSGWITLIYELRVKLEGESKWEYHLAGQQKMFNIFSLRSGGTYLIQVRCKPDHGFWSEWSSTSYIKVPEYLHREKSVWILISVFSAFILLILTCLIHMNSRSLKHCMLPPVPGPKIKGFDKQLLKSGKSDEVFSALVVSDFPPTTSNYEDLLVEYLEVYIPEQQEPMVDKSTDLHDGCLKPTGHTSDSDSGRGSCDSDTLLMDKCEAPKEEEQHLDQEGSQTGTEAQGHQEPWEKEAMTCARKDIVSPDASNGKVETWPSVFSPVLPYSPGPLGPQSSLEMAKQHCLSDSQFPPGSLCLGQSTKEALQSNYWEVCFNNEQPQVQTDAQQQHQAHRDLNISVNDKKAPAGLLLPTRSTDYVEVQRVNKENLVLLHPIPSDHGHENSCPQTGQGTDYSKVKRVDNGNVLLLQREVMVEESTETNAATESCYTSYITTATQKPTTCSQAALPVQDERVLTVSGYVDTATMFSLHTY